MFHCPYCGGKIKEDEIFCTQCGKKIPDDVDNRLPEGKANYRLWFLPIVVLAIILISIVSYYLHLENKTKTAQELFKQGEALALEENYTDALSAFESALQAKSSFPSAAINKDFVKLAIEINSNLALADKHIEHDEFKQALTIIEDAEKKLQNYNGDAVNLLINKIVTQRKSTEIKQLEEKVNNNPSINEIKNLLWEAEAIKTEESDIIADQLGDQIVAYVSSMASEQLQEHQFSNARDIVKDGLKYVPESEKLLSMKTTIEKEKTAFETKQLERIEQAMIIAEEERQMNENDAVELIEMNVTEDEKQNLVVEGKIKSSATVPITSISIEYILLDEDETEILANEVYIYPDTLYPDEEGKFDYTHYEIGKEYSNLKVKIDKIKWFLD